jgi:hypothetical protein
MNRADNSKRGWSFVVALAGLSLAAGAASAAPVVANADFETDANLFTVFPGYTGGSNPAEITDWAGTGGRGINPGNGAGTPFRDNGGDTTNVAFLQSTAEIHQSVSGFTVGGTYVLGVDFNSRNCCGGDSATVTASAGGSNGGIAGVAPVGGSNPYYHVNVLFTATATTQTLSLSNKSFLGGDGTALVDNVTLRQVPVSQVPLVNASFEADAPHTWPGGGPITGWTGGTGLNPSVGTPGCCGQSPFAPGPSGPTLLSPDGGQFAYLQVNGNDVSVSLSQTITGLVPGKEYFLKYYDAHRNGDGGLGATLSAQINGVTIGSSQPINTAWTERSLGFIAPSSTVTLNFLAFNNAPFADDQTVDVDGVRLFTVVPEPASLGLFAVAGLALLRRRK